MAAVTACMRQNIFKIFAYAERYKKAYLGRDQISGTRAAGLYQLHQLATSVQLTGCFGKNAEYLDCREY
jgi:hypothetical protein